MLFETDRQITIDGLVSGQDPIQMEYGKGRFLPTRVSLEYRQKVGEPWKLRRIIVGGVNVRKDNSLGEREHETHYSHVWMDSTRWSGDEPPEWLATLAADYEAKLAREAVLP